jgi:hypothetical protein
MASKLGIGTGLPRWFRWLARGFLLMSLFVIPFFYLLSIHWNYVCGDDTNLFLFIVIVVIVAWRKPVSGGIATAIVGILFIGPLLYFRATIDYWTFSYGLPELVQCLLLLVGGILSVMWGRTLPSNGQKVAGVSTTGSYRHSWFRWLPRGFLLIVAFMPLLVEGAWWYPGSKILWVVGDIYDISSLLMIAVIAWVAPIVGGIIAIGTVATMIFSYLMDFIPPSQFWASIEWLLLVIGGILSIIWGVMRWRWKHKQVQVNA